MLAHTLYNVHEHHETRNIGKVVNEMCAIEKYCFFLHLLVPVLNYNIYIGVISKENGYMSTSMG